MPPLYVAHRGYVSELTEQRNTLAAIDAAYENGFKLIEVDV